MDDKTIQQEIDVLARLTGAPQSFVAQVKVLFSSKGIPLDSDATPYVDALEEAFRREEQIRHTSQRAKETLERVSKRFRRVGRTYARTQEKLGRGHAAEAGSDASAVRPLTEEDSESFPISRDHRAYVTRQQTDGVPMVPGPTDLQ